MKRWYVIGYGIIAAVCAFLGIRGILPLWVGLFPIYFPVILVLVLLLLLCITIMIGDSLKREENPSCKNCLFNKTRELLGQKECIGEKFGAVKDDAGLCSYYERKKTN